MLKNLKTYWLLPWVLAFVLGCQKEKVPEPQEVKVCEAPVFFLDTAQLPPPALYCRDEEAPSFEKEELHKLLQGRWLAVQQTGNELSGYDPMPMMADTLGGNFSALIITKDSLFYFANTFSAARFKAPLEIVQSTVSGKWVGRFTHLDGGRRFVHYLYVCGNGMLSFDRTYVTENYDDFIAFKKI